jgi:hypothetical protein
MDVCVKYNMIVEKKNYSNKVSYKYLVFIKHHRLTDIPSMFRDLYIYLYIHIVRILIKLI